MSILITFEITWDYLSTIAWEHLLFYVSSSSMCPPLLCVLLFYVSSSSMCPPLLCVSSSMCPPLLRVLLFYVSCTVLSFACALLRAFVALALIALQALSLTLVLGSDYLIQEQQAGESKGCLVRLASRSQAVVQTYLLFYNKITCQKNSSCSGQRLSQNIC